MSIQLYRMDDTGVKPGVVAIPKEEAKHWNSLNYGIFHTIQEFKSTTRRIDNLHRIRCWAIDLDGDKGKQQEKIKKTTLKPSIIIESKNGYHIYWMAKDATLENYNAIVECRLIEFFDGDRKAKDVCRVLRTPGYYHCKDPNDKFMVRVAESNPGLSYSEQEMLRFFPAKQEKIPSLLPKPQMTTDGEGFWEKANSIPCMEGLDRLSGSGYVNGERFAFKRHNNGTYQICVNDKSTSSWIDQDGRIGSYERGGPGIPSWLNWYHNNWKTVAEIIKKVFGIGG